MKLVWLDCELAVGERLQLDEEHAHHLRDVLRMKSGQRFTARSSRMVGNLLELEITEVSKKTFEVELVIVKPVAIPQPSIELVQGYPKATKFDDVLRMAIEAGVSRVIPTITEYGDVKDPGRLKKEERWHRIAREAIEQSGNLGYNSIDSVVYLHDLLEESPVSDHCLDIVCHPPVVWREQQDLLYMHRLDFHQMKVIRLFVGPEGGFSPEELCRFEARGAKFYRFGATILRTEHAGLYALSTINTLLQYKGV